MMTKVKPLPETQKAISTSRDGAVFIQIYTDTKITNSNIYIEANNISEHSPLTPSEVNELIVDSPEGIVITHNDQRLVKLSAVVKWNDPKLRDIDPNVSQKARLFESNVEEINHNKELIDERVVASETVKYKSKKAKRDYRKARALIGLESTCEETGKLGTKDDPTEIHHAPREQDSPELAAEESTLKEILRSLHKKVKHGKDNEPFNS
ncbi:hypothetical protein PVK63_13890 [Aliivibrio sp. S2TY2]|uniref:hypothetical protein n=1 Tax=unclassified Aliivibrio TaxID=2645654 RepID=UPI0023797E6A|nr:MULTISPECIES: hypothetical protein [unclassified Aliivibrio]MDD9176052.1 hypothetical protein [Aliivibrio sp. S3TY1]MDD9193034.1 hypothetical protein [Aliivibrio sp. S2TY2]